MITEPFNMLLYYVVFFFDKFEIYTRKLSSLLIRKIGLRWILNPTDKAGYLIGKILRDAGCELSNKTISNEVYFHHKAGNSPLAATCIALSVFGIKHRTLKTNLNGLSQAFEKNSNILLQMQSGDLGHLKKITPKSIYISEFDCGQEKYSHDEFSDIWSGIFNEIDTGASYIESNYLSKRLEDLWWSLRWRILFILVLAIVIFQWWNILLPAIKIEIALLAILSTLGMIICLSLSISYIFPNNSTGGLFCNFDRKRKCEKILHSDQSKIAGIPLADLGLVYFITSFFSLGSPTTISFALMLIIILPVFFTPYSYYLQRHVFKNYCIICISILIIMSLMAFLILLILYSNESSSISHDFSANLKPLTLMSFVIIFLSILKPSIRADVKVSTRTDSNLQATQEVETPDYSRDAPTPKFNSEQTQNGSIILHSNFFGGEKLELYLSLNCRHCQKIFEEFLLMNKQNLLPETVRILIVCPTLESNIALSEDQKLIATLFRDINDRHFEQALNKLSKFFAKTHSRVTNLESEANLKLSSTDIELINKSIVRNVSEWKSLGFDFLPLVLLNGSEIVGKDAQDMFTKIRRKLILVN